VKDVPGGFGPLTQLLNMKINLWYNEHTSQWRWTLTSDLDPRMMESGNSTELRTAMDDVANTVEWMLETGSQEEWDPSP
jgi:hypothetical protein